jgi:hypothetical protein
MSFTVSFSDAQSVIHAVTLGGSGYPILLRGRHGIGKSSVVYQFGKGRGLPVVERRISQMTEGDLLGLPSTDGRVTTWNPPAWFKQACDEPVVLFLDELDRGTLEVRQGVFELADSRKLAGHKLHEGTIIIAACNGGEGETNYLVAELGPAELDRWTVMDVSPTIEEGVDYLASQGLPSLIVEFLRSYPKHFEHNGDFEPNKVYPSRRSWERLGDTINKNGWFATEDDVEHNRGLVFLTASSFVGIDAGAALQNFINDYEWTISIDDILANTYEDEAVERMAPAEFAGLVDALVSRDDLRGYFEDVKAPNAGLKRFFSMLPAEMVMSTWQTLCSALKDLGGTELVGAGYKTYSFGQLVADAISAANPTAE